MPMATKLGRVVTSHESSDPESHLTLWSRGLARSRDKLKIFPLSEWLWPPNLTGLQLEVRGFCPLSHIRL